MTFKKKRSDQMFFALEYRSSPKINDKLDKEDKLR